MKKKKTHKTSKKIPKVNRIVSSIASFLESGQDVGTHYVMTNLAKSIEDKKGASHMNTVRNKITEGFVWKRVLEHWEGTYRDDGLVDTIRKVKPKEMNMATIVDMLGQIQEDIKSLKKQKKK